MRLSTAIPLALMEEVRSALVERGATTAAGYTAIWGGGEASISEAPVV
jgi:hypothetical protein